MNTDRYVGFRDGIFVSVRDGRTEWFVGSDGKVCVPVETLTDLVREHCTDRRGGDIGVMLKLLSVNRALKDSNVTIVSEQEELAKIQALREAKRDASRRIRTEYPGVTHKTPEEADYLLDLFDASIQPEPAGVDPELVEEITDAILHCIRTCRCAGIRRSI